MLPSYLLSFACVNAALHLFSNWTGWHHTMQNILLSTVQGGNENSAQEKRDTQSAVK